MSEALRLVPVVRFPPRRVSPLRYLAVALERTGWTPTALEVDLGRGLLVAELHRADGRWVRLDVRHGKGVLERFQREASAERPSNLKSRAFHVGSIEDRFLGRQTATSPRQGLLQLAVYLADNPAPGRPALAANRVADLFGLALIPDPRRLEIGRP